MTINFIRNLRIKQQPTQDDTILLCSFQNVIQFNRLFNRFKDRLNVMFKKIDIQFNRKFNQFYNRFIKIPQPYPIWKRIRSVLNWFKPVKSQTLQKYFASVVNVVASRALSNINVASKKSLEKNRLRGKRLFSFFISNLLTNFQIQKFLINFQKFETYL